MRWWWLLILAKYCLASQSVTLAWDANLEPDIAGYIVYYGASSLNYTNAINAGNTTNITIRGLQDNTTYYFAVTAYNTNGLESDFSDEVKYTTSGGNKPSEILDVAVDVKKSCAFPVDSAYYMRRRTRCKLKQFV